ncbi:MAG: hypothetical protein ACX939_10190, partial [Hyphococcus sp.]
NLFPDKGDPLSATNAAGQPAADTRESAAAQGARREIFGIDQNTALIAGGGALALVAAVLLARG